MVVKAEEKGEMAAEGSGKKGKVPPVAQLLKHPLTLLALVPSSVALFAAGAAAGAVAKTVTAPLDRVKIPHAGMLPPSDPDASSRSVTYPLDVLRLRLAVQSGHGTMSQVALNMLREEGLASFYGGLGPSLIGIAPYIAVNFCVFDLMKKSVPEKYKSRPETSLATALLSATFATLMCYPLGHC
ncbi:hypothetical protein ACQ4PT_050808 [Festuca glaucescens]